MPRRKRLLVKPWRPTVNIPEEMRAAIEKRILELHYEGISEYLLALIIFDLHCQRPHLFTGPLMREPRFIREAVILEIVADITAGISIDKRPGGWFEIRLKELLDEERKRQANANEEN